jgi:hypothetical protein
MDHDFVLFVTSYNNYMRSLDANEYVYTINDLQCELDKCSNEKNIYSKIIKCFPTIEKFLLDNYYKIYIDGCQKVIEKNKTCNVCNNTFSQITAAKKDDEGCLIHTICDIKRRNKIKCDNVNALFHEKNMCFICNNDFESKLNIIFTNDKFCHKLCYTNKIKDRVKNNNCSICDRLLYTNLNVDELTFCYERKKPDVHFHSKCMDKKHVQASIRLTFNKCGACRFLIEEKLYIHDFCA